MCALRAGVLALRFTSINIATLFSVITLLLTEETLTPFNVFVLISFNNMLGTYLGFALLEGYEAYASLARIQEFLLLKNFRVTSSDRSSQKETLFDQNPFVMKGSSEDSQWRTSKWINKTPTFFKISSFAHLQVV